MQRKHILPLLVEGYTPLTVATLISNNQRYTITQNRGNVHALDIVSAFKPGDLAEAYTTVSVGGLEVIEGASMENYNVLSYQGRYRKICADYPGGQTISLGIDNQSGLSAVAALHLYHENPYFFKEWTNLLNQNDLSLHVSEFTRTLAAGTKDPIQRFVLPKNRGQIIGIQPICYGANTVGMFPGTMNVSSNGVTVIDNIQLAMCAVDSSRPNIFPIHLQNAGTIEIEINNAGGNQNTAGIRVFYAPDNIVKPLLDEMGC